VVFHGKALWFKRLSFARCVETCFQKPMGTAKNVCDSQETYADQRMVVSMKPGAKYS
jgi:hypothetical protein